MNWFLFAKCYGASWLYFSFLQQHRCHSFVNVELLRPMWFCVTVCLAPSEKKELDFPSRCKKLLHSLPHPVGRVRFPVVFLHGVFIFSSTLFHLNNCLQMEVKCLCQL